MNRFNIEIKILRDTIMEFFLESSRIRIDDNENELLTHEEAISVCESIIVHIINMVAASWHDIEDNDMPQFRKDIIDKLMQHPEIKKVLRTQKYLN